MRYVFRVLLILVCICSLILPVFAANCAQEVHTKIALSPDGSCQVSVNLTLNLENRDGSLLFPLPQGATNVSVNGSAAHVFTEGDVPCVNLDKFVSGMFGSVSLTVFYKISNVLFFNSNHELSARIPLLSGFSLPVEYMVFSISFPQDIPEYSRLHIDFYDTYLQDSIETVLSYQADGNTLTGISLENLKDHDSLHVTLPVDKEHFAEARILRTNSPWFQVAMAVCAGLAVLYWLLFLRFLPPLAQRQTVTPGSITAGEVGMLISNQGISLPLMVVSWAQLGYLSLEIDRMGRVLLRKKMDMGNERSRHEMRIFSALFRKKDVVNTAGLSFSQLSQRVYHAKEPRRSFFKGSFGSTRVYCLFFAAAGMFAGIGIASAWLLSGFLMVLCTALLAIFGFVSAILIQNGIAVLFLHRTDQKVYALFSILCWLLLGYFSGNFLFSLVVIGLEVFAGFTGPYAGRRTRAGRQTLSELYGLRRQIRAIRSGKLSLRTNTDYFYQLLPFALAFGMEETLAKAFSDHPLPDCAFLHGASLPGKGALQFAAYLKSVVNAMDERRRNLFFERFWGR